MRRAIITIITTITGIVLLLGFKTHPMAQAGTTPVTGPAPAAGAAPVTAAPPVPGAGGSSQTIKGTTVDTRYGPVQVQVTVSGTKITDVTAIQLPSDNGRDQQINSFAVPQLTQEVLAAQNSHVDMVSGGTYTSEGYLTSLQSALDQAGIK